MNAYYRAFSKVLESIDLRQSTLLTRGPTCLDDDLVTEILSTMIPHKLETVKVRKQFLLSSDLPYDEYCFPWGVFFTNLRLKQVRVLSTQGCSHCWDEILALHASQQV